MRGNNWLYQQVAVVYFRHSKRETETWTADIQTTDKSTLSYHFEHESHWSSLSSFRVGMPSLCALFARFYHFRYSSRALLCKAE